MLEETIGFCYVVFVVESSLIVKFGKNQLNEIIQYFRRLKILLTCHSN